ncbi:MAG: DNA alkylation repair protein, partial [Elusimicrobiota bacterium]|nr:DNA alkylation repair protein [Elusimicrobiota bacterium]
MKSKDAFLKEIKKNGNTETAKHLSHFFKTGRGEYGEGDLFWGLKVPLQRAIAKKYKEALDLRDLEELLQNKIHEVRLSSLFILIDKYREGG